MQQQQKQAIQERRRRSGALHAQSCEEYLKKYDQIGQIKIKESQRKKSLSESAFLNFDFIPADEGVEDITQLKIFIYSPKVKLNEQEFLQLLKRVRNRSITTDNISNKQFTFDFDFFYKEYEVNETQFGLHFWIQNNIKHQHSSFFQQCYYRVFNAAILLQRDTAIEEQIKDANPNCMIKVFPLMDELLIESLQSIIAEVKYITNMKDMPQSHQILIYIQLIQHPIQLYIILPFSTHSLNYLYFLKSQSSLIVTHLSNHELIQNKYQQFQIFLLFNFLQKFISQSQ